MAEWRLGRGWSSRELKERLEALHALPRNYPEAGHHEPAGTRWNRYYSQAAIAREPPGAPVGGSAFEQARLAIERYEFSDPEIVTGHFDLKSPLSSRRMLLEIKVLGLHYLCGTAVGDVLEDRDERRSRWGFRYDTLEGHIEAGSEWFILGKDHRTGEVTFRIQAAWRPGQFPNWWSEVGFRALGRRYQRAWHRLAYLRLRKILGEHSAGLRPLPDAEGLFHSGPTIHDPRISELRGHITARRVSRAGQKTTERENHGSGQIG